MRWYYQALFKSPIEKKYCSIGRNHNFVSIDGHIFTTRDSGSGQAQCKSGLFPNGRLPYKRKWRKLWWNGCPILKCIVRICRLEYRICRVWKLGRGIGSGGIQIHGDQEFSKMDAEKVASCISLIRRLGFQVIISATNDKIQNYLENVDKTFVFANPNKKSISIQEFEKREFRRLQVEE